MADIGITTTSKPRTGGAAEPAAAGEPEPYWDLIELLFFAYRDFVGDPDEVLIKLGFGRAHHRVLHFVNRNPGMKVAELLDILKITKQSLGRVLKQLIDDGGIFIESDVVEIRVAAVHQSSNAARLQMADQG